MTSGKGRRTSSLSIAGGGNPLGAGAFGAVEARRRTSPGAAARGTWAEPNVLDETGRITAEVAREMASAVFTPQRIDQLKVDMKDYGRDLERRQEQEATRLARAARMLLEREGIAPDENPLLAGICFASLRARMIDLGEEAQARGDA